MRTHLQVGAAIAFALIVIFVVMAFPRGAAAIVVNNPPVADPNGPYIAAIGIPISLDGSGSFDPDPGDLISLYEWDFENDGVFDFSSPSDPTATHVFTILGTFTVALRVTDMFGASDTGTSTVFVQVAPAPEPATLALFAAGLAGLGFMRRRKLTA